MTAAMAVNFVKNSDPVHTASHQTSHCTLCFEILSADHTLEIAASALLSSAVQQCRSLGQPDSIGCSEDIALLPGLRLAVAFVCMHGGTRTTTLQ